MFQSILFKQDEDLKKDQVGVKAPDFFNDLNLNQVIDSITNGKEECNLKQFYYTPLNDIGAIEYRQEIFRDLENADFFDFIKTFSQKMCAMRKLSIQENKHYYQYQRERLLLDSISIYCEAINSLASNLSTAELKSQGFRDLRGYLVNYVNSSRFTFLYTETKKLILDLFSIRYRLHIKDNMVTVTEDVSDLDYSEEVGQIFQKFKSGVVKDYTTELSRMSFMNQVDEKILERVAKLFPDVFGNFNDYYIRNTDFLDEVLANFDREIQFYIAFLEYIANLKNSGLRFCYPEITSGKNDIYNYEGFDLALAHKLINENSSIVCNDFYLSGKERVIVVTGPNQGGKTTFSRTFGQLHYLANMGCLVPGREAKLFAYDHIFTHFEKVENISNLRGKLEDDLLRIHHILEQSTPKSIIIMNEIFTSTTLHDAIFLSKKIMEKIIRLDLLAVWVTFIDELASFSEKTVSMVSTVDAENVNLRTFKIVRSPAYGLAYARSIAEKYRLTYDCLKKRLS